MAQNDRNDLTKLLGNKKAMEQVARSSDAQALASLLSKGHDPADLQRMAQSAMTGDVSAIQSLMKSITESSEGSELLRRLSENFGDN